MRPLIIDDVLSGGVNVSTEYYPGSFRAIGSKYKVSGFTSFKRMEDLLPNGGKSRCATLADCRLADLQTCRLADLQTCRPADLQTCRLADLDSQHTSSSYPKSFLKSAQPPLRITCLPEFPPFRRKQT